MIREQGFTNPAQQADLVFNRRSRDLLSAGVTGLGQARLWSHTVAPFTPAPVQIPASFFVKIIRTPFGVLIILTKGCYSNKNGVIVIFRNVNSLITFGHYLMDLLTQ